jgi:hypothetical protein
MNVATKKIKVSESVASEIVIRLEVAEVGDEDWPLLAQFDGTSILVFDAEQAENLARIACDIANGMDEQATTGENPESGERIFGTVMRGFWSLSSKLRKLF